MFCKQLWSTVWKEKVLGWSGRPFLCGSSPRVCAHPGSSACRCLLWNALPRVKVWTTSTKQNGYFKDFVDSFFSSWCIEKLCSERKIIWLFGSLRKVLIFYGKHLCDKDNSVLCQEMCLCVLVCGLYYCSFLQDNLKISWSLFHRCILHLKYLFNLCRLGKVSLCECF